MEGEMIMQFLVDHGYIIMFPLMIVIGPIVAIVASFMASWGLFNVYVIFILSLIAGMIGDVLLYIIGRKWGMHFVTRIGHFFGITEQLVLRMENAFLYHGGKIIIGVKSTTGLCWVTFIAAGIVRMPFWRFFSYTVIGGIAWSGGLVVIGYFFGYMYNQIAEYLSWASWITSVLFLLIFVLWIFYEKKKKRMILNEYKVKN
jgi:membrane-associated protein